MATAGPSASSPLQELLLSSTASTSPIPTTLLHSLSNGSLLFNFKSPVVPGSTSTASNPLQATKDDSADGRKSMGVVQGLEGTGGMILALGGKEGRAGINVWGFQKEQVLQRLIPPVRLSTLCLSHTGAYLAGGTYDGRIFFWEVSSGTLLLTIDAHYRPVSVLEFSHDDAALLSGGEDAGVSVWSIGRLMNATPLEPPTPFASLTDHTLAITAACIGLGTFPKCRVLTASLDSTCKIWDLSTTTASLLSTFAFPAPITHIAWDPLERFFFAASSVTPSVTNKTAGGSRVMRVELVRKREDDLGYEVIEAIGGGGRGEVENVVTGTEYTVVDTITALHLSVHSPTLALGTSTSQIHVLALPSLLPTRIIPPPLSSTSPGPITFLSTLLRPSDLGSGLDGLPARVVMKNGMGRAVRDFNESNKGGKGGRVVSVRIGEARDVRDLISLPSLRMLPVAATTTTSSIAGGASGAEDKKKISSLEEEVLSLRAQLGKAIGLNDTLWKRVVDGSLKVGEQTPMEVER